ncbi:MAG: gliding motility-associated C-terminal domain-containing protein [Bacteroidales bacterium]|nr:gliding motility-associated C-terminal domain-containing protein [Bacteroidales bacterium]
MPQRLSEIARCYLTIFLLLITGGGVFLSAQTPLVTGNINRYARVTSVGADFVIVDDLSGFAVDDTVMVMQMNGVRINAGVALQGNYQNVEGTPGRYEILIISSINSVSRTVSFSRLLLNAYSATAKVQLIKVRSYRNAVVNTELSCQAWDSASAKGGVLAFMVKGVLTLNADINLTGKGFTGGIASQGNGFCQRSDDTMSYESYRITSKAAGYKGEGIGFRTAGDLPLYPDFMRGKGANMTGGGGGNGRYSGGGGGSNYGAGSVGDNEIAPDICSGLLPGGRGGFPVTPYPTLNNGIFLGGGGGASVWLTVPSTSDGGEGGGIIIIHADTIRGNGRLITASGGNGSNNTAVSSGAAGGGAGGSVAISTRYFATTPVLNADGGKGGDNVNQNGAGGGGGGGLIWTAGAFPGSATVAGGQGGIHSTGDPNKDGLPGTIRSNLNLPLNGFLFNEIYVSHNLMMLDSICEGMIPPGMTGTRPAGGSGTYTYQWQKSYDNSNWSDVPGTAIAYTPASTEAVSLWFRRVVSDGAGITDISKAVRIIVHPRITGNLVGADTTLCYNQDPHALYQLNAGPAGGTGLYHYLWEQSPDNVTWSNASGTYTNPKYDPQPLTATSYYHRVVSSGACTDISTPVTITILPSITGNTVSADQAICEGTLFSNLTGTTPGGGASPSYTYQWMSSPDNSSWSSAAAPNNGLNYDPQDDSPGTTWYRRMVYSGLNNTCQSVSNTVQLVAHPSITNNIISAAQTICEGSAPATLDGTLPANGAGAGTYTYQWMTSINGTAFLNIPGATTEDFPGTALTASTWYRRVVTSSACTSTSNDIKITVDPRITVFAIGLPAQGHDTICTGTAPALLSGTPAGGLGTYVYSWASSTDNVTFTGLSATTPEYQPGNLTATTWFSRTVTSGACSENSVFRITVLPLITGNTITANQTVCNTQSPAALSGSAPGGGDGIFRYLWESKAGSAPAWTNAPGANTTASYQPPVLDGTTQFRRNIFSGENDCCTSVSAPVTVTVDIMPTNISAGTDRTLLPYQFAALLEGSFEGEGIASWSYDFAAGKGDPVFSTPGEKTTEVRKLGFGDNTFILSVTNGQCVAAEVPVTLTVPELIIPQGVTPNGDGINDYFNIEGLEYTYNELVIINTGGAVVYRSLDYRSDDPIGAWTGLDLSGNEVPEGTYYFLLTIKGAQDMSVPTYTANISGFLILKR